jgi:hypothetical protein
MSYLCGVICIPSGTCLTLSSQKSHNMYQGKKSCLYSCTTAILLLFGVALVALLPLPLLSTVPRLVDIACADDMRERRHTFRVLTRDMLSRPPPISKP